MQYRRRGCRLRGIRDGPKADLAADLLVIANYAVGRRELPIRRVDLLLLLGTGLTNHHLDRQGANLCPGVGPGREGRRVVRDLPRSGRGAAEIRGTGEAHVDQYSARERHHWVSAGTKGYSCRARPTLPDPRRTLRNPLPFQSGTSSGESKKRPGTADVSNSVRNRARNSSTLPRSRCTKQVVPQSVDTALTRVGVRHQEIPQASTILLHYQTSPLPQQVQMPERLDAEPLCRERPAWRRRRRSTATSSTPVRAAPESIRIAAR